MNTNDKVTLTIDCDNQTAKITKPIMFDVSQKSIPPSKAEAIAWSLLPEIQRLMQLSKDEIIAELKARLANDEGLLT